MKKILLLWILCTLVFTANFSASEYSKQEMLRDTPIEGEQVAQASSEEHESRMDFALLLSIAIIVIVVGLGSMFATRFALSLRSKNDTGDDQIDL